MVILSVLLGGETMLVPLVTRLKQNFIRELLLQQLLSLFFCHSRSLSRQIGFLRSSFSNRWWNRPCRSVHSIYAALY